MIVRRDDSTLVASEVRKGTLAGYYHSDRAKKIDVSTLEKLLTDEWYHRRGFSFSILIMLNRN